MKKIKHIYVFLFLVSTLSFFAQNKKLYTLPPHVENLPPTADFSWINSCLGDTTCFINQTLRGNTYTWTISSTGSHPHTLFSSNNDSSICYYFTFSGTYSVSLTAYNNHYNTMTKIITIDTFPKANFNFIRCKNSFVNTSLCSSYFYWDFGDGTHSTNSLPIHQYPDTGSYNVTLIAYKGNVSDTMKSQIHIYVPSYANGNFIPTISHDTLRVYATYTTTSTNVSYNWAFADGGYATGQDTIHIYKDSTATYLVELLIQNACGNAYGIDTVKIIKDSIIPNVPPSNLDFSHSILTIAPNPVSNNSYVDAFFNSYNDNIYLAQIYNALGEKMFEENFAFQSGINEFKISTANLSSGLYILTLQAGNSYIRQKFYIIDKP